LNLTALPVCLANSFSGFDLAMQCQPFLDKPIPVQLSFCCGLEVFLQ